MPVWAIWVNINLKKGAPSGDLIEVFGPLEADDVVLRRATEEIHPGARVNVRSAPAKKG